ncbi:hypothetical protein [Solimonas terrae]|uniref:Uncharacterized protein n=1 Tax=Solimonas terrae TaxID=1396819 RepID=A0A6M2BX58_9GAMM|nr:hypothetical protein [Solimonas terrae]NGY06875.1 hypothetical protein [Solimonas terrae]
MDKRALTILHDAHWGSGGWKRKELVSDADFAYAKEAGVMFDTIAIDHDGIVRKCLTIRERIEPKAVADAFITSLATRSLAHRSALGSYAVLKAFPSHAWAGEGPSCDICGSYSQRESKKEDLNVLNFERFKWGGVRHLQALYAAFDLEQFQMLPHVRVLPEHVSLFKELIACIENVPPGTSSAQLHSHLPKALKSNKPERDILLGILGIAGVLQTAEHRGFQQAFVRADHRALPDRRFVDMAYPACWWSQSDGINKEAVKAWFGHLL